MLEIMLMLLCPATIGPYIGWRKSHEKHPYTKKPLVEIMKILLVFVMLITLQLAIGCSNDVSFEQG